MAIAPDRTKDQLLADARAVAADIMSAADRAAALQRYVVGIRLAGLEQAGFATDDATEYQVKVSYMDQIASIIFGQAALAQAFDFSDGLAVLAGPPR